MSFGAEKWGLWFLVLASGLASAQIASPSHQALPEAPSAIARPFPTYALVPAPPRKLSPAERPFEPLSPRQKFMRFTRSMYSPYTLFNAVYDASWGQATGSNRGYGGGMEGWGDRIGAAAAGTASRQFFGTFLFPAMLRQDPRYFAMYHGSVWRRFVHAASRTILTKGDNGHTQFDASTMLAIGASQTLQNTWLPAGDRSLDKTLSRIVGSIQGTATSYVLREFSPDIVHLFKRHSPHSLRRLEDKIPEQLITGVPPGDD